jgi:hypothetical protein
MNAVEEARENNQHDPKAIAALVDIERRVTAMEMFSFFGGNCEEITDRACDGWDGISRRCDCGNRRVEWIWEYGAWHGEAY